MEPQGECPTRAVLIAVDDTLESDFALNWALKCLVKPTDRIHVVSVRHSITLDVAALAPATLSPSVAHLAPTAITEARWLPEHDFVQ